MSSALPLPRRNRLIERLPRAEREALLRRCEDVELADGDVLCQSRRAYAYAYFPVSGLISVLGEASGHPALEIGLIGSEGMLGSTLVLGVAEAPHRAEVHGIGRAWRIASASLQEALERSPMLLDVLHRHVFDTLTMQSQTTVCTCFHDADVRLVRWLLLTHDRVAGDTFHLTHQRLANMLGLQRSAVTIAAGELQKRRLISYTRGEILILDRAGLEAACCECYALIGRDTVRGPANA